MQREGQRAQVVVGRPSAHERQGGSMKEKFFLIIDALAAKWLRFRVERNLKYLEAKVKELHANRPEIEKAMEKIAEAQIKARFN